MLRRLAVLAAGLAFATTAFAASAQDARRCTVTKPFDIYAIPSGYEDGTKDVFARGVPRGAKNIDVRFVRADGHPVGSRAFPLQTWASKVKGFRGDGTLWVQITLSGYGYGMPVARVSHWRAIVSYDCRPG